MIFTVASLVCLIPQLWTSVTAIQDIRLVLASGGKCSKGKYLAGWYSQQAARSMLECAVLCYTDEECNSVNYLMSEKQCQLNNEQTSDCMILQSDSNQRYLTVRSKSVQITTVETTTKIDTTLETITTSTTQTTTVAPTTIATTAGGTNYILYQTTKPWATAKTACIAAGGWLATISSVEEQAAVEAPLTAIGCPASCPFTQAWIGGYHDGTQWIWDHENTPITGFTKWHRSFGDATNTDMYFLAIQPHDWNSAFGEWMRYNGNYARPYICEIPS